MMKSSIVQQLNLNWYELMKNKNNDDIYSYTQQQLQQYNVIFLFFIVWNNYATISDKLSEKKQQTS